jgi:cytochrome c oxidase cbb3-type subunit 4
MDYETLRHFADSWGLLILAVLFVGIIVFIFRKGSTKRYREAAEIPLRDDDQPRNRGSKDAR